MAFWGIVVEPGKPFIHCFDKSRGRLHISQATLGPGYLSDTSIVQCIVGDKKNPIFLCGFSMKKANRSCPLDLEFEEKDDVVFSVLGPLSVHLTGFYLDSSGRSGDVATENNNKVEDGIDDHGTWMKRKTYTIIQDAEAGKSTSSKSSASPFGAQMTMMGRSEDNKKAAEVKPRQVTFFANGLIIEDLEMGIPDGRIATPRAEVSIYYIGKLESNGFIFEANVGKSPSKFRLGKGELVKGCEIGVNGMRIGDKRRLTIPPSMGHGSKGREDVPPNEWLVFDVELVDIC